MTESQTYFSLSPEDKIDALEVAASKLGRPADLIEKDIWVVWVLDALFDSDLGEHLVFKGGTSLSKVMGRKKRALPAMQSAPTSQANAQDVRCTKCDFVRDRGRSGLTDGG